MNKIDKDEIDLEPIKLSVRTKNVLLLNGLTNKNILFNKSDADLLKIRNLGRKTLNEIRDKIILNPEYNKNFKKAVNMIWVELNMEIKHVLNQSRYQLEIQKNRLDKLEELFKQIIEFK